MTSHGMGQLLDTRRERISAEHRALFLSWDTVVEHDDCRSERLSPGSGPAESLA